MGQTRHWKTLLVVRPRSESSFAPTGCVLTDLFCLHHLQTTMTAECGTFKRVLHLSFYADSPTLASFRLNMLL